MSTYADYFNAQYRGDMPSGPVRLTISKNESDMQDDMWGQEQNTEHLIMEELMDQEDDVESGDATAYSSSTAHRSHPVSSDLNPGILPYMEWIPTQSLVWVIDTNVLLRFLPLLQSLCEAILRLQWNDKTAMPRVYMVVPLVVLEELDQLKQSTRMEGGSTIGASSRQASHWILDTVQRQKYVHDFQGALLAPARWVLHVQTASTRTTKTDQTNDQAIVSLCTDLTKRCSAPIILVSDDTNARTMAEIEGLASLSLVQLVGQLHGLTRSSASHEADAEYIYHISAPELRHLLLQPNALHSLSREAISQILPGAHVR